MATRELHECVCGEIKIKFDAYRGSITRIEFSIDAGPVTVLEHDDPCVMKSKTLRALWASLCQRITDDCDYQLRQTDW